MEKTFCGRKVELTVPLENLKKPADPSQSFVFGEIREQNSQTFRKGDFCLRNMAANIPGFFIGEFAFFETDLEGMRYQIPSGRWKSPAIIKDLVFRFVCYFVSDDRINQILFSSEFTITGITHKKRQPKVVEVKKSINKHQEEEETNKSTLAAGGWSQQGNNNSFQRNETELESKRMRLKFEQPPKHGGLGQILLPNSSNNTATANIPPIMTLPLPVTRLQTQFVDHHLDPGNPSSLILNSFQPSTGPPYEALPTTTWYPVFLTSSAQSHPQFFYSFNSQDSSSSSGGRLLF